MLAVNGKPIDFNEKSNPYVVEIEKAYKEIKKMKFPIRFKFPEHYLKPDPINKNRPKSPAGILVPYSSVTNGKFGSETWTYFETSIKRSDKIEFYPERFNFSGNLALGKDKIDLIYYLLYKCPYSSEVKSDKKTHFVLVDTKKDAEKFVREQADFNYVHNTIFSESSDEGLRKIAKAFFIPGIDEMHTKAEVQQAIWKHVDFLEKTTKKGYKQFIEHSNLGVKANINITIQEA